MAEIGQVTKVDKDEVVVRLFRQEACAKCGACAAGLESKDMFIHANNVCEAHEDEWVEIYLEETNFLKAVGLMYGIPLLGLLFGLLIGMGVGNAYIPIYSDAVSFIFGILGAGITFLILHVNEHRFNTKTYKPRAIRIVDTTKEDIGC
jgi:sigma-E factor negative regulatory protein RseC